MSLESFDDGNNDTDTSSSAADEFMKIYDSCQKLHADVTSGRRRSSIISIDEYNSYLPPHPSDWKQRPLLLRPSPGAGMKIRGVRFSSSKTYIKSYEENLPINNGMEARGRCLVIDFESDLFIGTACLRLKNAPTSTSEYLCDDDYFRDRKRTFQAVIRGRFKKRIPVSECMTGQLFNRPAGVLPPRVMIKAAVLLISRLAPQLQSRLEGDCPRFLSPLCSAAQTVFMSKNRRTVDTDEDLEIDLQEPLPSDPSSFIKMLPQASIGKRALSHDADVKTRIKERKRAFDKLYSSGDKEPSFCTESEYCFEFFQHLIIFDKYALDFPKPIGQHSLKRILNGQPLKILALHQEFNANRTGAVVDECMTRLWSFDIFHESLYDDAIAYQNEENE